MSEQEWKRQVEIHAPKRPTPRWIVIVQFLLRGKHWTPKIAHTIAASSAHVAAARGLQEAKRSHLKRGDWFNEVLISVKRAILVMADDENTKEVAT